MVDRIGSQINTQTYVSTGTQKRNESEEKFNLQQGMEKEEDGVVLELSGNKPKEASKATVKEADVSRESHRPEQAEHVNTKMSFGQILAQLIEKNPINGIKGFVQRLRDTAKLFFHELWNGPAQEEEELTATELLESMEEKKAQESAFEEKQDTMDDFLHGTQKGKLAHNTTLLTYYDKSGKMVNVNNTGRILKGK